ncbi:conserved hypothetical protein [Candidatus Nitrospira nitrosa]|uniref:YbjN domain-containing protein n=1 Tax=Candidatus Nitrospira nitrosa TaxID=1742972 RepID=A0A0S4LLG3_9BACT|nr:YbjN domain-containing protein [Candidatus Nitrospira nitrosa]CUS37801.1 conserved hypothetical protein [Candidatus Nitrospira nitrosa]
MIDWRKLCTGAQDVQIDGEAVVVTLGRGRQHRVDVASKGEAVELRAVIARRAMVDEQDNPALAAWYRNRAVSLVGFRVDDRGRLVGESWVPGAGLTADEFLVYLRGIATACDLFEFQLTGKDRE